MEKFRFGPRTGTALTTGIVLFVFTFLTVSWAMDEARKVDGKDKEIAELKAELNRRDLNNSVAVADSYYVFLTPDGERFSLASLRSRHDGSDVFELRDRTGRVVTTILVGKEATTYHEKVKREFRERQSDSDSSGVGSQRSGRK